MRPRPKTSRPKPRPVWSIQLHVKVKQIGMLCKIFVMNRYEYRQNRTQTEVITLEEQMIDLRPRDQNVWDRDQYFTRPRPRPIPVTVRPRPIPKVVWRPRWSRDLNSSLPIIQFCVPLSYFVDVTLFVLRSLRLDKAVDVMNQATVTRHAWQKAIEVLGHSEHCQSCTDAAVTELIARHCIRHHVITSSPAPTWLITEEL